MDFSILNLFAGIFCFFVMLYKFEINTKAGVFMNSALLFLSLINFNLALV